MTSAEILREIERLPSQQQAEVQEAVARLLASLGLSDKEYLAFLTGEGRATYDRCQEEAAEDHVFGVPFFIFRGEQFWGHDRLPLLEQRLGEASLDLGQKASAAS